MFWQKYTKELNLINSEISAIAKVEDFKPKKFIAIYHFLWRSVRAIKLIFCEKEIIVLALLQWLFVALGYCLWVQVLGWVPEEFLQEVGNKNSSDYVSEKEGVIIAAFFIWSVFCVGLVAFPLGVLTSCMGIAHLLHRGGQDCTIDKCLSIAIPRSGAIWIISWIDGWWTACRIFDRISRVIRFLSKSSGKKIMKAAP